MSLLSLLYFVSEGSDGVGLTYQQVRMRRRKSGRVEWGVSRIGAMMGMMMTLMRST